MLVSHFMSEKQAHISVSCWHLLQKLPQRLLAPYLVSADSRSVLCLGLLNSFVLICNLLEQLAFFLLCV